MAFEAGVVQRRAALAGFLVDGGVRGKQQLHATVPAFVAGSVWRAVAPLTSARSTAAWAARSSRAHSVSPQPTFNRRTVLAPQHACELALIASVDRAEHRAEGRGLTRFA